jgi:hypothetical protein
MLAEPVLSKCERDGIAFLPWSPLAAGSDTARVSGAIAAVAARHRATAAQVAIAWLLARSPVMLPIPGSHEALLTEAETARLLCQSPRTLQAWRIQGAGPPYVKIGRCVRYRRRFCPGARGAIDQRDAARRYARG